MKLQKQCLSSFGKINITHPNPSFILYLKSSNKNTITRKMSVYILVAIVNENVWRISKQYRKKYYSTNLVTQQFKQLML